MNSSMQISGLGVVGGFGCGTEDLKQALLRQSASLSFVELRGHEFPLFKANTATLETYVNKRALRRIDHFSRMALLGAFQAMSDADLEGLNPNRVGVVICSGYGALNTTFNFLDSVIEDGDTCASPTAFSNSVHNAAAAHISMQLKLTGPNLTVSQFDQSLISGLVTAQQWIAEKRVDAILLGVVDEYCSVLGYCWERYFGLPEGTMRPLDFSTTSAIAGEGAAFFVLQPESETAAKYGRVDSVEMGNLSGSQPTLPFGQPLILGCTGHAETGALYNQQLEVSQLVACYSPLYGASPVTQAFDLAVAALSLQQRSYFSSADGGGDYYLGKVLDSSTPCDVLSCLNYGFSGEYGAIHLSQGNT